MTVKAKAVNRVSDVISATKSNAKDVTISAPNFVSTELTIAGTAPYVQLAFGEKARNMMREKQAAGSTASK